jgi:hypothetical protein
MENIPYNSYDLIEKLNQLYKHKCPTKDMTDRDIWIYSGKRELIDSLLIILEYEKEKNGEK